VQRLIHIATFSSQNLSRIKIVPVRTRKERLMDKMASGVLAVALTAVSAAGQSETASARSELAPTGTLRVGINYNNPLLARRDAATGELRGVAVDLSLEVGRRLDLPVVLIPYGAAGRMADAVTNATCDLAFLAVDPARARGIEFTAPYIEIEGTYLVPAGSPLRRLEDVDRDGIRIAVTAKSAYDLFLMRELKHARLRAATTPESIDLMVSQKLDAVAAVRTALVSGARHLPGSRILSGHFMTIPQAVGIPRGRPAAAAFVRQYIEDVKASGFVASLLERHSLKADDAVLAPPAPVH
jgi:polar amino acid transport system substrate-binding protein